MSDVSVLVPSYGRAWSLSRCLEALARQDDAPCQIVVVARRHDQQTRAVAEAHHAVTTVLVDAAGVAHAVERGVAACTSRIVALTDDDAEPLPDWVTRIDAAYRAHPRLGAFGGRDLVVGDSDSLVDSALVGRIHWYGRITGYHHRGAGAAVEVDHLKGVNLSVLRSVAVSVPLADRTRGRGAQYGFELQLCLATRQCGLTVVYDPDLQVVHHAAGRSDGSARKILNNDQVAADTHNFVLAVRAELPRMRAAAVGGWAALVGEHNRPGIVRALLAAVRTCSTDPLITSAATLRGVASGWRGATARPDPGLLTGRRGSARRAR